MKKLLVSSIVLLFAVNVFSQKDFEGMIRYKATSPNRDMESGEKSGEEEIKIFFSPGKILISTDKNREESDKEEIIILIDSAKIYTLDKNNKTYNTKKLKANKSIPPASSEIIAGYKGTPQQFSANNLLSGAGGKSTLWFADDLFFSVPAKYASNEELLMIQNNRILLKAIIRIDERMYNYGRDEEEEETADTIEFAMTLVAVEVIPGVQPASLFTIPADYTKEIAYEYNVMDTAVAVYPDSMAIALDTAAVAVTDYKMPPPQKKTPAKAPVKKATTSKPPAKKED